VKHVAESIQAAGNFLTFNNFPRFKPLENSFRRQFLTGLFLGAWVKIGRNF
jgi:hypothetical protein